MIALSNLLVLRLEIHYSMLSIAYRLYSGCYCDTKEILSFYVKNAVDSLKPCFRKSVEIDDNNYIT